MDNDTNNEIRTNFDRNNQPVDNKVTNSTIRTNFDINNNINNITPSDNINEEQDDTNVVVSTIKVFLSMKLMYLIGSILPFWLFFGLFFNNKFIYFSILIALIVLFVILLYISMKNSEKVRGRKTSNSMVAKIIVILGLFVLIYLSYVIFKIRG